MMCALVVSMYLWDKQISQWSRKQLAMHVGAGMGGGGEGGLQSARAGWGCAFEFCGHM